MYETSNKNKKQKINKFASLQYIMVIFGKAVISLMKKGRKGNEYISMNRFIE